VLRTRRFLLELADPKATPRVPLRVRQRAISLLKHLPTGGDLAIAAKALPDVFGMPGTSLLDMAGILKTDRHVSVDDMNPPACGSVAAHTGQDQPCGCGARAAPSTAAARSAGGIHEETTRWVW
jgi:hypothetical protein